MYISIKLNSSEKLKVKAYLEDKYGNIICKFEKVNLDGNIKFSSIIENINSWSAENPYLYKLYIELLNENEELIEIVPQRVGFRKFEMIDKVMCLNGKRIMFKGVNRHEFSSKKGRAI